MTYTTVIKEQLGRTDKWMMVQMEIGSDEREREKEKEKEKGKKHGASPSTVSGLP